jgi:NitT/TauT family transport system substrate-binding protein
MKTALKTCVVLFPIIGLVFLASSCRQSESKFKIAYLGLTCEAPIFVAHENGFFKDEGVEVELVKTDWDGLRQGLGLGRFDANHTLIMYLLKPIEGNLDVKITGGIHTGCLRIQVAHDSPITHPKELKGKRIGVPTHIGSPPYLFASRVLVANGINPDPDKKEVTWLPFPPDVLGKALEDGRIDALATSDPIGMILVDKGIVKTIADQAIDAPYADEYCCAVVVSGRLARDNPAAAAKLTRGLLKGAKWVQENPSAAANLSVDKRYTVVAAEVNAHALAKLSYRPGVGACRKSVLSAAKEMLRAGLLKSDTDAEELTRRAWADLEGVTDDWLKTVSVERVPGGGVPRALCPGALALMCEGRKLPAGCCD